MEVCTLSSSQTALHRMPMQSSLRLRPSAICMRQCWRQQALQKPCPQSIAVASLAATSQKQHWHSSVSAWPGHTHRQAEQSLLSSDTTQEQCLPGLGRGTSTISRTFRSLGP